MKKTLSILIAAVLVGLGSTAYALVDSTETQNQQQALKAMNSEGEFVGTVTNALVDTSGNLAFIILSMDGMDGAVGNDRKEIAVPLGAFTFDRENKVIILNMGSEKLSLAPEFNISDLNDPTFPHRVYRFFGLMPAWTEGEEED